MTLRGIPLTPTQTWQDLVPELPPNTPAEDTAERLLLLLHYSIDWNANRWGPQQRKAYWDAGLAHRIRRAARRAHNDLGRWWTIAAQALGATSPGQSDRRLELAVLLREPAQPVLEIFRTKPADIVLRVQIITEANRKERRTGELG